MNTPKRFAVSVACGRQSPTIATETDFFHLLGVVQSETATGAQEALLGELKRSHPPSEGWKGYHAVSQEIP